MDTFNGFAYYPDAVGYIKILYAAHSFVSPLDLFLYFLSRQTTKHGGLAMLLLNGDKRLGSGIAMRGA